MDTKHLIDGNEAARILGITKNNFHQRLHRGQIKWPAVIRIGSAVLFDRRRITKLAAQPR